MVHLSIKFVYHMRARAFRLFVIFFVFVLFLFEDQEKTKREIHLKGTYIIHNGFRQLWF